MLLRLTVTKVFADFTREAVGYTKTDLENILGTCLPAFGKLFIKSARHETSSGTPSQLIATSKGGYYSFPPEPHLLPITLYLNPLDHGSFQETNVLLKFMDAMACVNTDVADELKNRFLARESWTLESYWARFKFEYRESSKADHQRHFKRTCDFSSVLSVVRQNATVNLTLASHNINWVSMLGPLQACCEVQLISSAEEIQQWQAQVKPSAVQLIDPEAPVTA